MEEREARINSCFKASSWLSLNQSAAACISDAGLGRIILVFCTAVAHHEESKALTAMYHNKFWE